MAKATAPTVKYPSHAQAMRFELVEMLLHTRPWSIKDRMLLARALQQLADAARPPYRPEPGRGRPPIIAVDEDVVAGPAVPLPPLTRIERQPFDYSELEADMTHAD